MQVGLLRTGERFKIDIIILLIVSAAVVTEIRKCSLQGSEGGVDGARALEILHCLPLVN